MSTRNTCIVALLLVLAGAVFSLSVYNQLPGQMASHWNFNDQVDGTMSRFWGAFLIPIITIALLGLLLLIPVIDPLKANIGQFRAAYNLFMLLMTAFLTYMHALTLAWNLGYTSFRISAAMLPASGLFFIFIGYMLAKAKRNFFIGIRTPWTLSSDTVWAKTHSLGSKLFVASGIIALLGMLSGGVTALWFLFAPLIGSTIYLVIYSYFLYRQETKL